MTPDTMHVDLPYLMPETDRHGRDRLRVRVKVGGKARSKVLKLKPGEDGFLDEYRAAVEQLKGRQTRAKEARKAGRQFVEIIAPRPHSLGWLTSRYFASDRFLALAPDSQRTRRGYIEDCLDEPLVPGGQLLMRDCPYLRVTAAHIRMLRDRRREQPGAANNRLKYMGAMFSWAVNESDLQLPRNPCRDVTPIEYASDGFYTWSIDDVRQYVARHPRGTTAYLALALMLFLGARKQDAIRLGPQNLSVEIAKDVPRPIMVYVPKKTNYRSREPSAKPILPPLMEAIKATPVGLKTYLVTQYGKPFTDNGFTGRMRAWCDQAGLPMCTSHGLRKAAATICAELGATDRMLMSLFDWMSERMATVYTRKANKKKLAGDAAALLASLDWKLLLAPPAADNKSDAAAS